jgi:hypothetical protein
MNKFDIKKLNALIEIAKSEGMSYRMFKLNGIFYTISYVVDQTQPQGKERSISIKTRKGTSERLNKFYLNDTYDSAWDSIFKEMYDIYFKEYHRVHRVHRMGR